MQSIIFHIIFLIVFFSNASLGNIIPNGFGENLNTEQLNSKAILKGVILTQSDGRPSPLLQMFRKKQAKNKKLTAAALAFPFPFGIVGLHRIYLGCAPYIPVVYIATVGGAFGILPLIDFCVILSNKTTDGYVNNKNVFMWVD